jgi:hypothetical protein
MTVDEYVQAKVLLINQSGVLMHPVGLLSGRFQTTLVLDLNNGE